MFKIHFNYFNCTNIKLNLEQKYSELSSAKQNTIKMTMTEMSTLGRLFVYHSEEQHLYKPVV